MRVGMSSARISVGLAVALAVLECTGPVELVVAQEAALPQAPTTTAAAFPDFDGDGTADLVYGVGTTRSYVALSYGSGRSQTITRTDAGGTDPASDDNTTGFGQGLLARNLNGDAYADLVVVDASQGAGSALYLVFGSADGLRPAAARRYPVPSGMYGFHGSPALLESPGRLLVVSTGVPGIKGGAVLAYQLGADGLPTGAPKLLSQQNLPGTDENGDAFGTSIAASGNLLLIGIPGEDLGSVQRAGAVLVLKYGGGFKFTGTTITQRTAGVTGKAERWDGFGRSVAIAGGYAAVGVPGEDLGKRDAGAVHVFKVTKGELKHVARVSQDSKWVSGKGETGDMFGYSVAIGRTCDGYPGLLVGAPHEAIGSIAAAGSAWLIPIERHPGDCPVQLYEGGRLGGTAREMASVGAAVSMLRSGKVGADTVVLTSPGMSEEGVYGRVITQATPFSGNAATVAKDLILNENSTLVLSPPAG